MATNAENVVANILNSGLAYYNITKYYLPYTFRKNKIIIKNYEMNYLKVGHGPHRVIFAPGGMGSIWTDFKPQIEGFDRNKFSLFVIDPPGHGKSIRLSDNNKSNDYIRIYADIVYHFMRSQQISKYSYLGWCMGAKAGIILAALHPDVIEKLVIWGTGTFFYEHEVENFKKLADVNNLSPEAVKKLIELYGEDKYVERSRKWSDEVVEYHNSNISIIDTVVKDVKCPTLILGGGQDPLSDPSHAPYIQTKIKNSRLHVYPKGKHNIHLKYAEDFNKRVQDFLLEPTTCPKL